MNTVYRSIKALQPLDFSVMLSGHGEPLTSDASTKVKQFIDKINSRKTIR
jgi:hypothetical protein